MCRFQAEQQMPLWGWMTSTDTPILLLPEHCPHRCSSLNASLLVLGTKLSPGSPSFPLIPSPSSCCLLHNRPINWEMTCWGRNRNLICKASRPRRWWTRVPKNHLPWVRIQASFILKEEAGISYSKRGGSVVGCCKLLDAGILCSYSCPHSLGLNVPVNIKQDKCYSLFWNFYLYMSGKVLDL